MAESFDLRPLKVAVQRLFPPTHPLRESVLAHPDEIPLEDKAATLAAFYGLAMALRRK